MSSPLSIEDHQYEASSEYKTASAPLLADDLLSKDTIKAAEKTQDGPSLPPQPSPAPFAFDETLFGSAPIGSTAIEDEDHEEEIPYPEAQEDSLLPPPDFKSFFTLIEDALTGDHQHPTVHYLFADDDQDILTAAALETVSEEQQGSDEERFVIVDISANGREVVSVSSLSPEWQTLKTKVTQAPSWGDESKSGERGLMLRISGQEAEGWSDRRQKGDVDGLLKAFDQLAGNLDGVFDLSSMDTDTQTAQ